MTRQIASNGVDPALMAAYAATDFHVDTDPPLILRVGQPEPRVDAVLMARGVTCGAYLTAWNPFSRITSVADNAHAQSRLMARLRDMGLTWITGRGQARTGDWPAEESLLVRGIPLPRAIALARDFDQNAILWLQIGAAPVLVDCTLPA